jgi:hypothetical protein
MRRTPLKVFSEVIHLNAIRWPEPVFFAAGNKNYAISPCVKEACVFAAASVGWVVFARKGGM